MLDFLLQDGDSAVFLPNFGHITVIVKRGRLIGTGPRQSNGRNLCIEGDETLVQVAGCMYQAPDLPIPGYGTLRILSLMRRHRSANIRVRNKPALLKGDHFIAQFFVQQPALRLINNLPVPDTVFDFRGHGFFVTTNVELKDSFLPIQEGTDLHA